jgi:hypothetical protein
MNLDRKISHFVIAAILSSVFFLQLGCQREEINRLDVENSSHSEFLEDDFESEPELVETLSNGCKHATAAQKSQLDLGVSKRNLFLERCYEEAGSKKWCDQVARPNPESHGTFDCTYSKEQAHVFVHPSEDTWAYAIGAVKLVTELEAKSIAVATIYNWWRPEPYNANVGGAAGRHPYGTSVDVRFPNKIEQNKAHRELCKWRKQGRLRALGYYSGTGLHFGIGDKVANTWGKSCP